MPVHVELLPNEPIILANMTGSVFQTDLIAMFEQSRALIEDQPGPFYRITNTVGADINFGDLVAVLSEMARRQDGTTQDPRIRPILVGTHPDAQLIVDSMKQRQYGEKTLLLFEDVSEAIAYARAQIAGEMAR